MALLKINKAQFGTAVWLNGQKLGEYAGCFSASYFHLERRHPLGRQEHPGGPHRRPPRPYCPTTIPPGRDFEKIKWTPGIYDSVSLIFCDNPRHRNHPGRAAHRDGRRSMVQTRLKNYGSAPAVTALGPKCEDLEKGQKSAARQAGAVVAAVTLDPGEEKVVTQTMAIPQRPALVARRPVPVCGRDQARAATR